MKSALPGILLTVAGALITYWSLTKLGLFVPKTATATPPGTDNLAPNRSPGQGGGT